ncbi:MAG TPA: hypothetical protein EYQ85_04750 [Candidatus Poseidoniales archaeon]|nr:hypothetical protein [Candidatus Poseidoniales archaeon]
MPRKGTNPRPVFSIEARNLDELNEWKSAAKELGKSQTKMGAMAIRQYLHGEVSDPEEVTALKQRIEELEEQLLETRSRVTTLDRANVAANEELVRVRARFYGASSKMVDTLLVQLFYSTLIREGSISRKELLSRIQDAFSIPNLVDELRHIEMIFANIGILNISKGVLTWKME